MTMIRTSHASHPGHMRQRMEDGFLIDPRARLHAVIDGMGGHGSGEIITRFMIDLLERHVGLADVALEAMHSPGALFASMNQGFIDHQEEVGYLSGQGASCAMARMTSRGVLLSHIGGCRAYLVREGRVTRLTQNHSLVEEFGEFYDSVEMAHYGHVLTRALALSREGALATHRMIEVQRGDRLVLCTDGLWRDVEPQAFEHMLRAMPDEQPCEALLEAVLQTRASDNIAVIVVDVDEAPGFDSTALPELDFGALRSILHQPSPGSWAQLVAMCDAHALTEAQLRYALDLVATTWLDVGARATPTHWLWDVVSGSRQRPELQLCDRFAPASGTRFTIDEFFALFTHPHLSHITELVCGHDTLHHDILHELATHPGAARLTTLSWQDTSLRHPLAIQALLDSPVLSPHIKQSISPLTESEQRLVERTTRA